MVFHLEMRLLHLQEVEEPSFRVVCDALEELLVEQVKNDAVASQLEKAGKAKNRSLLRYVHTKTLYAAAR